MLCDQSNFPYMSKPLLNVIKGLLAFIVHHSLLIHSIIKQMVFGYLDVYLYSILLCDMIIA